MSAVMLESAPTARRQGLEPEGRGHELLQTWALYRRGGEQSHSPVVSGYLREPLDKAHDNEPSTVLGVDRVLAGLIRSGHECYVEIVKRFYLSETPLWKLSGEVRRTEGFVRLSLRAVCALVDSKIPE